MHCIEEEFAETSKKSSETVVETRCDDLQKISEREDKVYAKAKKSEETRRDSHRQAANILTEEKVNDG